MNEVQAEQITLKILQKNDEDLNQQKQIKDQIRNILLNKARITKKPFDDKIFETDLVMKIDVNKFTYTDWKDKILLGDFVNQPAPEFTQAYEEAFSMLSMDMQKEGDVINNKTKKPRMRYMASLIPLKSENQPRNCMRLKKLFNIDHEGKKVGKPKKRQVLINEQIPEEMTLKCGEQYNGIIDAFTIQYNALIYSLQHICGFKVSAFLASNDDVIAFKNEKLDKMDILNLWNQAMNRKIFVFLHLPEEKINIVANQFGIQKEIDYKQIDPFLNEPKDRSNRPIKLNTCIREKDNLGLIYRLVAALFEAITDQQQEQGQNDQDSGHSLDLQYQKKIKKGNKEFSLNEKAIKNYIFLNFMKRKTCERKLGFTLKQFNNNIQIVNQRILSEEQKENYSKFNNQMKQKAFQLLYHKNEENRILSNFSDRRYHNFEDPEALTDEQIQYLYNLNRKKINPGVEKRFLQIKKKRKYFDALKELSEKYGYQTYQCPLLYAPFRLPKRKQSYFCRLNKMLVYKQQIVSPFGDLSLFTKMERIKISYLLLRKHLRIENLKKFNLTIFALQDDYQKFGSIGKSNSMMFHKFYQDKDRYMSPEIRGGLDGQSLIQYWKRIKVWGNNFKVIRGYLGQDKAFQVFIKTYLIVLFMCLIPFAVGGEFIKRYLVRSQSAPMLAELLFNLFYLLITVIGYSVFMEVYKRGQQVYKNNYIDKNTTTQFRKDYQGPYIRDLIYDNANKYDEGYATITDKLIRIGTFIVVFLLVGVIVGFYYGMRSATVQMSQTIEVDSNSFYLFRGVHLISYSIFFTVNMVLYSIIMYPVAVKITTYQNWPTQAAYLTSVNFKLYIFAIAVEIIGPIDLVYVQMSAKTQCLSNWCYKELQAYIYSRYFIMVAYVLISAGFMLFKYLQNKKINLRNIKKFFDENEENEINFSLKLSKFLSFVAIQSEKEEVQQILLIDETIALVHFCTFVTVFPLAPAISFFSILIAYNVQRQNLLSNCHRPIPKSRQFQSYSLKIEILSHWLIFYNISQMILTLDWLQYFFQDEVIAILGQNEISPSGIQMLKYFCVLVLFSIFELAMMVVKMCTKRLLPIIDERKHVIFEKYITTGDKNTTGTIVVARPHPIISISRVDFDEQFLHQKKKDKKQIEDLFLTDENQSEIGPNHNYEKQ